MARTPVTLDTGRLRIGDALFVYLERIFAPERPLKAGAVPRPHGVAPTAMSPTGMVLASVAPGEAVWLGFQAVDRHRPVTVRVRLDGHPPIDAVTGTPWQKGMAKAPRNHLVCPPDSRLVGVPRADGCHPFASDGATVAAGVVEELTLIAWVPEPVATAVQLVRPQRFTEVTGVAPEPIDPDSAYRGWRLP